MERWLVKMWHWAHNPPPMWKVKLVFAVILLCLALFGYERLFGWPEFLRVNPPLR